VMTRRKALLGLAGALARAATKLPANRNVRWALGSNLWNSFPGSRFTDILDVMRDTGFIGLRLTQYPQILAKYDITEKQMEEEVSRRGLHVITISFNGPAEDPAQHADILARARTSMEFLKRFGANMLVVFSPRRGPSGDAFATMCRFYNRLGETGPALEWLRKAVQAGYSLTTVRESPDLDNLRNNPRYQALVQGKQD